jgi:N-carbamoylputrescine amidase
VANGYFMGCINRVGTEAPWNIGKFYGSSTSSTRAATSSRRRTRTDDAVVVAEMDLDMIEEVRARVAVLSRSRPETYEELMQI